MMNRSIQASSRLRRHDAALEAPLHDDLVVTQSENETYFGLATTGKRIWDLLGTPHTAASLCDELAEEFNAERTTLESDVFEFLTELDRAGLIVIEE